MHGASRSARPHCDHHTLCLCRHQFSQTIQERLAEYRILCCCNHRSAFIVFLDASIIFFAICKTSYVANHMIQIICRNARINAQINTQILQQTNIVRTYLWKSAYYAPRASFISYLSDKYNIDNLSARFLRRIPFFHKNKQQPHFSCLQTNARNSDCAASSHIVPLDSTAQCRFLAI